MHSYDPAHMIHKSSMSKAVRFDGIISYNYVKCVYHCFNLESCKLLSIRYVIKWEVLHVTKIHEYMQSLTTELKCFSFKRF